MPPALQGPQSLQSIPRAPGGGLPGGQAGEGAGLPPSQRGLGGSQCLGCHQASQNWLSRSALMCLALAPVLQETAVTVCESVTAHDIIDTCL